MPADNKPLPRGVTLLERARGGRRYRTALRHKGAEYHLGIYETEYLAGFAYHLAAEMVGRRSSPPDEQPETTRPSAAQVRTLTERVAKRLGIAPKPSQRADPTISEQALTTFFEVTVLGFWTQQAASDHADSPGSSLDSAASRVVEAADLLLSGRVDQMPTPEEFLTNLLVRRLDLEFRKSDLTREIIDDDGEEAWRVARWLIYPEKPGSGRGFREEIRYLYPSFFSNDATVTASWAEILGIDPTRNVDRIRDAYRLRSKTAHPDAGGSAAEFVRLQRAYEEALAASRASG